MTADSTQDEIEKIMSEIENLQEVMNENAEAPTAETVEAIDATAKAEPAPEPAVEEPIVEESAPAAEAEPMAEFRDNTSDVSIEETLGDLKDDEPAPSGGMLASIGEEKIPEETVAEEVLQEEAPVAPRSQEQPVRLAYTQGTSKPVDGGSLSLRLTGSMTLTLEYDYEGEQVTVGFADNMLHVQLSDGTEFKIPVRRDTKLRRVA